LEKEKMKKQVEELKASCLSSDEKRKEMEKLIKKVSGKGRCPELSGFRTTAY